MALTLASNAITFTDSTSLSSGIIGTAQLSAGAVTGEKIANNAVTQDKISAGAVVRVLQTVRSDRFQFASTISNTSTIPTITTGAQVLSASITPFSSSNLVLLRSVVNFTATNNPNVWFSYFRDSTCIGATKVAPTNANFGQQAVIEILDTPNSITSVNYQVRGGTTDGQTIYVNGWNSGELGPVESTAYKTTITLMEIKG